MGEPCLTIIKTPLDGKMPKENAVCPAPTGFLGRYDPPQICLNSLMLVGMPLQCPPPPTHTHHFTRSLPAGSDSAISRDTYCDRLFSWLSV